MPEPTESPPAPADDDGSAAPEPPSTDDQSVSADAQHTTEVNTAMMSLFLSFLIWSVCFYRAFALRRAMRERLPR